MIDDGNVAIFIADSGLVAIPRPVAAVAIILNTMTAASAYAARRYENRLAR